MSGRELRMTSSKSTHPISQSTGFYRAFEERFRGPREVIKKRLEVYLPFVKPLQKYHPSANVLDLGCGRGEWLELMRETGFEVEGVDLDAGMLQACSKLNLPVVQGDAIAELKKKADQSHSVVSAFHVVEHMAFEQLNILIAEALRVLKPAGLLILETPNPENIVVATTGFYLDPTHLRPIPPDLLTFLSEYHGFYRSKILRLQQAVDFESAERIQLLDVLGGVSPDYAVVAQKAAEEEMVKAVNLPFNHHYGVSLKTLAEHYHDHREKILTTRLDEAKRQFFDHQQVLIDRLHRKTNEEISQFNTQLEAIREEQNQLHQDNHHYRQLVETQQQRIDALLNSTSWRITWPLRILSKPVKWLVLLPVGSIKALLRPLLKLAIVVVMKHQGLRESLSRILQRWPTVYAHLKQFALYRGLMSGMEPGVLPTVCPASQHTDTEKAAVALDVLHEDSLHKNTALEALSPRARQNHLDLKAVLKKHQKERN